jgi:hypothetical protein
MADIAVPGSHSLKKAFLYYEIGAVSVLTIG